MRNKFFISIEIKAILLLVMLLPCNGLLADVQYEIPLNAEEHQVGNMLEWSTSMELNSQNFVIEKSLDGIQFDFIGTLEAAGMTGEGKSYRYLDLGVNDDKTFYRLKQIDYDGQFNYSQTVLLNKELSNQFMVVSMSNTTFNETFQFTIDILLDTELNYSVYNLDGDLIGEFKEDVTYGLNDISVELTDEPEGHYKIIITLKDEEEYLIVKRVNGGEKKKDNVASKRIQNGG